MGRELGVCPRCFGEDIEALNNVFRRCRRCGKHFGQPRSARRPDPRRGTPPVGATRREDKEREG